MPWAQPQVSLGAEIAIISGSPANHLKRQVVSGRKTGLLLKAKWFTLMITHKKMHGTQPQLELGAEIHKFSGNPVTRSSIRVVSGSKAEYWSKAKLFDK